MNTTRRGRRYLIIFLAWLSLGTAAFAAETVTGNGVMRTQERNVSGFSGIALAIPARMEVKLGATESVTIEADENLLPLIETTTERGTLEIKPVRRNLNLQSRAIRIVVQAKELDRLAIRGAGSITAAALNTKSLSLDIAGAGDMKVDGAAKKVTISIAGSGDVSAGSLLVDDASVKIAGSGDASVAARSSLGVTVAGSGSVSYYGDPSVSRTVAGSGSITRVGPLPR